MIETEVYPVYAEGVDLQYTSVSVIYTLENGKQVGGKNVHKLIRKGSGRWYVDDYEIRF